MSEGRLTVEECLKSLNSFQNNKSPGMGSVFFLSIFFAELMFPFFVITKHHLLSMS